MALEGRRKHRRKRTGVRWPSPMDVPVSVPEHHPFTVEGQIESYGLAARALRGGHGRRWARRLLLGLMLLPFLGALLALVISAL